MRSNQERLVDVKPTKTDAGLSHLQLTDHSTVVGLLRVWADYSWRTERLKEHFPDTYRRTIRAARRFGAPSVALRLALTHPISAEALCDVLHQSGSRNKENGTPLGCRELVEAVWEQFGNRLRSIDTISDLDSVQQYFPEADLKRIRQACLANQIPWAKAAVLVQSKDIYDVFFFGVTG